MRRIQGKALADAPKVWVASALAVLASTFNPNDLGAIEEVMRHYRDSLLLISIFEWNYPAWCPPSIST